MATADDLNLLVDCLICRKRRAEKSPRQLDCQHGFCLKCLTDTDTLIRDNFIQCPVCWQKTPVPEAGINELRVDSKVCYADKALQAWKKGYTCVMCMYKGDTKAACAQCSDCDIRLCNDCVTTHKSVDKFSNHLIITHLCKMHIRVFTHACITCLTGLCFECVLSEFHEDDDISPITEVTEKITALVSSRQTMLAAEIEENDKMVNSTMDQAFKVLKERRKETEEKLDQYRKKLFAAVKASMDKREDDFQKATSKTIQMQNEASSHATNCLNEWRILQQEDKLPMLDKLYLKAYDTFQTMATLRTAKATSVKLPELQNDKCDIQEDSEMKSIQFHMSLGSVIPCMLEGCKHTPEKMFHLAKLQYDNREFKDLWSVTALTGGTALFADSSSEFAFSVNERGDVLEIHHSLNGDHFRGSTFHDGNVYMGDRAGRKVTVITKEKDLSIPLQPIISCVSDLVIDNDTIVLVHNGNSLLKYSIEGNLMKKLASGRFMYFTVAEFASTGKVYLVSDYEKCQLCVYRPDGSLIRTMGESGDGDGQLRGNRGIAVLPNGTILVADYKLHRISEFTSEGEFVRHILTEKDGLKEPVGLSISYPYLWVACWKMAMLYKWK